MQKSDLSYLKSFSRKWAFSNFFRQFSDLLISDKYDVESGEYEGGSVLWECSIDLIRYLSGIEISANHVLDLGCGQGRLSAIESCILFSNLGSATVKA